MPGAASSWENIPNNFDPRSQNQKSIIGAYGSWAVELAENPPGLSYRNKKYKEIESWKKGALTKVIELVSAPSITQKSQISVDKKYTYDGLIVEEISWQPPYGNKTKAILLKP